MIPENLARRSYNKLLDDEYLVEYMTVDGLGHGANIEALRKIKEWAGESHDFIRRHYEEEQTWEEKA